MHDLTEISSGVAERLRAGRESVAVAESSSGGLISASLLAVPGASRFFKGGSVVYTLESRKQLLGIRGEDVRDLQPLTEEMVAHFARAALERLDATWGIAELGIAGPTGSAYGHPPGISVIAVEGPVSATTTVETGDGDREENMWRFTQAALELFQRTLDRATD